MVRGAGAHQYIWNCWGVALRRTTTQQTQEPEASLGCQVASKSYEKTYIEIEVEMYSDFIPARLPTAQASCLTA